MKNLNEVRTNDVKGIVSMLQEDWKSEFEMTMFRAVALTTLNEKLGKIGLRQMEDELKKSSLAYSRTAIGNYYKINNYFVPHYENNELETISYSQMEAIIKTCEGQHKATAKEENLDKKETAKYVESNTKEDVATLVGMAKNPVKCESATGSTFFVELFTLTPKEMRAYIKKELYEIEESTPNTNTNEGGEDTDVKSVDTEKVEKLEKEVTKNEMIIDELVGTIKSLERIAKTLPKSKAKDDMLKEIQKLRDRKGAIKVLMNK